MARKAQTLTAETGRIETGPNRGGWIEQGWWRRHQSEPVTEGGWEFDEDAESQLAFEVYWEESHYGAHYAHLKARVVNLDPFQPRYGGAGYSTHIGKYEGFQVTCQMDWEVERKHRGQHFEYALNAAFHVSEVNHSMLKPMSDVLGRVERWMAHMVPDAEGRGYWNRRRDLANGYIEFLLAVGTALGIKRYVVGGQECTEAQARDYMQGRLDAWHARYAKVAQVA